MADTWSGSVAAGLTLKSTRLEVSYMARMSRKTSTLVGAGLRFGIANSVVTPPAAAAAVHVSMVSLCSYPGSLVWT